MRSNSEVLTSLYLLRSRYHDDMTYRILLIGVETRWCPLLAETCCFNIRI